MKLARALWIVPMTIVVGSLWKSDRGIDETNQKVKRAPGSYWASLPRRLW